MPRNKNKLRICMISCLSDPLAPMGGSQTGGASIYIYELARELSRLGVSVDIFTRFDSRKTVKVVRLCKSARVIRLKAGPRVFVPQSELYKYLPDFVEQVLAHIREKDLKYDLIHCHQYFSGKVGASLKEILEIPMVETFHSLGRIKEKAMGEASESPKRYPIELQTIKVSDLIIATANQEKSSLIKLYGASEKKISVIPCGVNLNRFSVVEKKIARNKIGVAQSKKVVVFAARMYESKGALTLVEAIRYIKKYYPMTYNDMEVLMFSGDPRKTRRKEKSETLLRRKLRSLIDEYQLNDHVKLSPAIDQEKLHYYYAAADVVTMPSYYEPFGLVAIEAMASGCPVIASRVGGLKEIIRDGITGFLVEAKKPKMLAQRIKKIVDDKNLEDRMRKNCAIDARQNYSWQMIAKKILKSYEFLISRE